MKIVPIEVAYIDHCGSDLSVVNAARVSFHKESDWVDKLEFIDDCNPVLSERDSKLINYLAKHKHHSPFNHAFISVRVKAPILCARQMVKHKFMPWNEVSRRYVDEEPEMFAMEWRVASDNVKQGSGGLVNPSLQEEADKRFWSLVEHSLEVYDWMLENGICPEQARAALLLDTMTEWRWSGTLGAFGDMLKLRLDPHTQKETRDVAELIKSIVEPLFPVSLKAILEN